MCEGRYAFGTFGEKVSYNLLSMIKGGLLQQNNAGMPSSAFNCNMGVTVSSSWRNSQRTEASVVVLVSMEGIVTKTS